MTNEQKERWKAVDLVRYWKHDHRLPKDSVEGMSLEDHKAFKAFMGK